MEQTGTFAVDTTKRSLKQWIVGLLVLLVGLTVAHLGVTLFLMAQLGTDTFTILVEGISGTVGLSIGTCHVIMCILLMVIMLFTTKGYVKPGTVLCAFCGGWIIDFFLWVLGDAVSAASPMVLRIGAMLLGCVLLSAGMSLVIKSNSGTGPNDLVAIILTDKLPRSWKLQFRWVRIICDVVFVAVGWLLGGVLGVGTVVAAVLVGPIVQFFLPISEKLIRKFVPVLYTDGA